MVNDETIEIIKEAYEYCEKLYNGMNSLTKSIDERNLLDLETYFKNILEGFNWILEVGNFATTIVEGEKLDLETISQMVNEYINAYNNLDLLLVRDIIEYELMPQVEIIYNILKRVIEKY
ncbi:hypothetical protein [Clostridium sp. YIM B02551]|uniref:hypothetical protein n=1 Tax=Clostridium sp. YIM B02551 TaxID=2910679 RepID=UPI001EEBB59E|nr:hypothetical protein [Clostridium sp. YIM B02551]